MRVAANLAWLVPGDVGGSEQYTTRLLAAVLRAAPSDLSLEVVGSRRLPASYPWIAEVPFKAVAGPLGSRGYRIAAESTQVRRATRRADLVHHFGGRLPALRNPRAVVTIHDLQPLEHPGNFSRAKRRYLCWAVQRSARAASLVCTPSQWVAESVVERLGVDADKVRVVSSTWCPEVQEGERSGTGRLGLDGLWDRLGSGPLILYPAATHPHKNHLLLLEAVERLAGRAEAPTLVMTGGRGRAEALVASKLHSLRARVLRLGRVSPWQLSALTRRADVLAFPSRYEGFGLPLLEAMHSGTAVIAGDNSAMPEVLAGAGLLVGVDDVDGWVDAISEVLTDRSLAERLSAAGRTRARAFAPAVCAGRLIGAWRDALGRDG